MGFYHLFFSTICSESFLFYNIGFNPYILFYMFGLGAIFILRKDIGVGWWSRKWQFPLTLCSENGPYVGWWVVQKSLKKPLPDGPFLSFHFFGTKIEISGAK